MGRGFGVLRFFLVLILLLFVGGAAYSLGLAAGQAPTPAETGTVVYPVAYWHPWFGFPFFGILFFFLFIGLIFAAFGRRRWGGGGPGGWGRGWYGPVVPDDPRVRGFREGEVPPAFQPMLESWHRRAHGEPSNGSGGDAGTAGPSGPTSGSGPKPAV
jgi:hypothetical protein